MTAIGDIFDFINKIAPFSTALPFDNAGLIVGNRERAVTKAGVVLDITPQAVRVAGELGCELIVSHHPVIFHPLKFVREEHPVYMLASKNISAICAHTNLDAATGGVNCMLASALGLADVHTLETVDNDGFPPMARIGKLTKALSGKELADLTVGALGSTGAKYFDAGNEILTVAVCGGAGSDFILPAKKNGADALITAEIKHHEYLLAKDFGLTVIDAGHYATENVIVPELVRILSEAFPEVETVILPDSDLIRYVSR